MRNVLLQLYVGAPVSCRSWAGVPVAHGLQLTVYVERPGGIPERLARHLHATIRRELIRLGGFEGVAPCEIQNGRIYDAWTCEGAVAGLVNRVMVYVADGGALLRSEYAQYFSAPGARVIPVVDNSVATNPAVALPGWMRTIVAVQTNSGDPAPALSRIIRSAGLLSQTPSIFVSYVHAEARDVAAQLFHALTARGYAAFLDRFTGAPGDDFVELIDEELANKACLLALETPGYRASVWCEQEVATAIDRHMGLIALDLPGSLQSFPEIAHRIDATHMQISSGRLHDSDVEKICDKVDRLLPHEISRRPRHLDHTLRSSLRATGVGFRDVGLGRCEADLPRGRRLIAMWPTTPDAEIFCEVDALRNGVGGVLPATIVAPVAAARTNRRTRIDWLQRTSGIEALDEGGLARFLGLP